MAAPSTYSLLELNQYVRRVISLNFDQPLWIECEIGQASQSRGHWYLDLIQKEDNQIVAQCQAALWANVYFFLKRKSPVPPEDILQQGMAVKLKINVDYHERYGLKLIIEDIDSSYTVGKLELQRQAILKALQEKDLIRRNARDTQLPAVVQRLAVISSAKAAGYKDFMAHLQENGYGYDIEVTLFESAMQGQQVEAEMLECLNEIADASNAYDAVAIIRGGGGRTDLAAFDNLPLAVAIAHFPIAVLIGIGHEIDESVLDLVAYASLKTPTAVADFVVEHNLDFENRLADLGLTLREEVEARLEDEQLRLERLLHQLQYAVRARLAVSQQQLHYFHHELSVSVKQWSKHQRGKLDTMDVLLQAIDPDKVLARGFSITSVNGKTVLHAADVSVGMVIQTALIDGTIKSKVE